MNVDLSPEEVAAVEASSNLDRDWFIAHPTRAYHVRRPVPFERGKDVSWIVVHQIQKGVRLRMGLVIPDVVLLDTEAEAKSMFEQAVAMARCGEIVEKLRWVARPN